MVRRISETSDIPKDELNVRLLYRTLGVFDNMAMFARHKVIPTKWVLELWHHPLNEMYEGVETLRKNAKEKNESSAAELWPQLWILLDKAQSYHSTLPCCPPDNGWRARIRRLATPSRWRLRTRSGAAE
jgi:hypothetical protein